MKKMNGKLQKLDSVSFYDEKLRSEIEFRAKIPAVCMDYAVSVRVTPQNKEEIEMLDYVLRLLGPKANVSFVMGVSGGKRTYSIKERNSKGDGVLKKEEIYKRILESVLSEYSSNPDGM